MTLEVSKPQRAWCPCSPVPSAKDYRHLGNHPAFYMGAEDSGPNTYTERTLIHYSGFFVNLTFIHYSGFFVKLTKARVIWEVGIQLERWLSG